MKKVIIIAVIALLGIASAQAQEVTIVDSTIVQDIKLRIAYERLFSENHLISTLQRVASEEKASTDTILYKEATEAFINDLMVVYNKFAMQLIKVDTLVVDKQKLQDGIVEIESWQQKVISDPDIQDATSLKTWKTKNDELVELKRKHEKAIK